jgi:DUF2075 family protein
MGDNEACFYTEFKFEGDSHCYPLGTEENLWPGSLNDRFKSVQVGRKVKVLAWQHANNSGKYREWSIDQDDITDIDGLSRFNVVADTTLPIAARLDDNTGAPTGQRSLTLISHQVGQITVRSGEPDFHLVGIMPAAGPPVTTAIHVRDEQTGEYLATGSIYFAWNADTKSIDVADETNLPTNVTYERSERNKFTFTLNES